MPVPWNSHKGQQWWSWASLHLGDMLCVLPMTELDKWSPLEHRRQWVWLSGVFAWTLVRNNLRTIPLFYLARELEMENNALDATQLLRLNYRALQTRQKSGRSRERTFHQVFIFQAFYSAQSLATYPEALRFVEILLFVFLLRWVFNTLLRLASSSGVCSLASLTGSFL